MIKSAMLLLILSTQLQAQSEETQISLSTGTVGGSYYDVPTEHDLDKYGAERLSPKGISMTGTLESDALGSLYIRRLSANRAENQTHLGTQTLFFYDSPKIPLPKIGKHIDLSVKGNLSHYSQKDHLMFFKVDGEFTPAIEANLEQQKHVRANNRTTFVAPEAEVCYGMKKMIGDFSLEGFAQASLAPLGIIDYKTEVTENKMDIPHLENLDKNGATFAVGGEILFEGMAKYKDQYYLKLRFLQAKHMGTNGDKISANNRVTRAELGYLINKHMSVSLNVDNSELVLKNKDRRAIDVYNVVGLGLKYSIPNKKKQKK